MKYALLILLSCPKTIVINKTSEWTAFDQKSLETAKVRCGELYERSKCAKVFYKLADKRYQVICGV